MEEIVQTGDALASGAANGRWQDVLTGKDLAAYDAKVQMCSVVLG